MNEPALCAQRTIDHEALWRAMKRLLDRVFLVLDSDTVLDDCLDVLLDLLGGDRGLVLVTQQDGSSHIVNARGPRGRLATHEREEISRSIVHDALESGRCVVWDVLQQKQLSSSIATLGIRAALAAPLLAGASKEPRGVLYVDFRDPRKFVEQQHVDFFMSSVALFGAVLEQHGRGQVAREQLAEAKSRCVEARQTPPLAELLAPPSMAHLRQEIASALTGDSPFLVMGESGTGKTLLATAIAEASGRRPIVRAVLGGSDDLNTITSELFGHERGAFSGAAGKRVGLVEYADGGTLILDEVLNLPPHAQKLLLDFTQFGTYRPLGYSRAEPKRASVRILAATNGDLDAAMREGRFREDLYYRLAAVPLRMPPLRQRREDLPALAESALRRADRTRAWSLSIELRRLLLSDALAWPGNVRQFERAITRARERAIAQDPEATTLHPGHLGLEELGVSRSAASEAATTTSDEALGERFRRLQQERTKLDEAEADVFRRALAQHGGVVAHAAKELGLARTTLASRLQALGLDRK